jgi:hypothetical protein
MYSGEETEREKSNQTKKKKKKKKKERNYLMYNPRKILSSWK